jgi:aspartate aminotransferase-like enzyme
VKRFDSLPFQKTEAGFFVEVAVTVQSVTLSQIHPVLDSKNRPIDMPSAFDINTSIQRCLVKAIALHGLGLYIYAGEDLPAADVVTIQQPAVNAAGTINAEQIERIKALLAETGQSLQRVLAFFRVSALSEIKVSDFPRVVATLEKSKRRAA